MKDIPIQDRPREKLINLGPESLGDSELLAILISSGNAEKSVTEISKGILNKYNIEQLSNLNTSQLKKEFGIGTAKACQIVSSFEMGRRASSFTRENIKIRCSQDIIKILAPKMSNLASEHFKCIYLNTKHKVLKEKTLFQGTLNESVVHPREIFKIALEENAAAVILAHNHPSGDPTPSEEDVQITKELIKAGEVLGIKILDHIIIGKKSNWSIMENRLV